MFSRLYSTMMCVYEIHCVQNARLHSRSRTTPPRHGPLGISSSLLAAGGSLLAA
eukprot:COSAG01_NODE_69708_length_260_cov_1.329193_1_plen_53_part_10